MTALALRPVWLTLLVVGVVLAGLALLIGVGWNALIVPLPEKTGELFFAALSAHDYGEARSYLTQDLQQALTADQLQALARQAEAERGTIGGAHGQSSQVDGLYATAQIELDQPEGTTLQVPMGLHQEQGIWKISTVQAYLALPVTGR